MRSKPAECVARQISDWANLWGEGGDCSPQDSKSNDDEMMKDISIMMKCVRMFPKFLFIAPVWLHIHEKNWWWCWWLLVWQECEECMLWVDRVSSDNWSARIEREKLQYFSYSSILFIPVTHLTIHDIHFYETFLSLIWQKGSLGVFKTLRNSSPRKRKKQN